MRQEERRQGLTGEPRLQPNKDQERGEPEPSGGEGQYCQVLSTTPLHHESDTTSKHGTSEMTSFLVLLLNPNTLLHRIRTHAPFFHYKERLCLFARFSRAERDRFPTDDTRNADWGTEEPACVGKSKGKVFFLPYLKITTFFVRYFFFAVLAGIISESRRKLGSGRERGMDDRCIDGGTQHAGSWRACAGIRSLSR